MSPVLVLSIVICGTAGWAIARREGHPVWGAFAGGLLGPLGVAITGFSLWRSRRRAGRIQ